MMADEDVVYSYQPRGAIKLLREGMQLVQVALEGNLMAQRNSQAPLCLIAAELERLFSYIWPSAKGCLY